MTKKDLLTMWMKEKGIFATHDIIMWGIDHYYNTADREKRRLQQENKIKRISDIEKVLKGYKCKDAVYEWIG